MRRHIAIAGAAGVFALALAPAAAQADNHEATVSVLHAVPGLTVDVYANGEELIPDFAPGTLTDPLQLPAGTYDIQVFADGDSPDNADPAIEANGVEVPAGANATVVAQAVLGVSSVLAGRSAIADGFGLLGMASVGPIILLLLLGLLRCDDLRPAPTRRRPRCRATPTAPGCSGRRRSCKVGAPP